MEEDKKKRLIEAIYKKAVGYSATECVEEMSAIEGELTLSKKRVTTKEVPPDATCAKLIMESFVDDPFEGMDEERLLQEKERLLGQLKAIK